MPTLSEQLAKKSEHDFRNELADARSRFTKEIIHAPGNILRVTIRKQVFSAQDLLGKITQAALEQGLEHRIAKDAEKFIKQQENSHNQLVETMKFLESEGYMLIEGKWVNPNQHLRGRR